MRKVLLLLLFIPACSSAQNLARESIQREINTMLISTDFTSVNIKFISPAVNNLQIAGVEEPYREFPTIVLFVRDSSNQWRKVFEGLSPGIQSSSTNLHDWHTSKAGVDFSTNDSLNDFHGQRISALIDATSEKKAVMIPYENFLHIMIPDNTKLRDHSFYTVDKTSYLTFAQQFFGASFIDDKSCNPYYTPSIREATLSFNDGHYTITALTQNNQVWTYTFDGVDNTSKYIINKVITVATQ